MTPALSIDFGNNYTKVGIRTDRNATSELLRSDADLRYDDDNICVPTVAARVVRDGKDEWLFGTEVKLGSSGTKPKVFRNWKPRFFRGEETHLEAGRIRIDGKSSSEDAWATFENEQLERLLSDGSLVPEKRDVVKAVLQRRTSVSEQPGQDLDYEKIGTGYFAWLRRFVEPFCKLRGIGTTGEIPVRITLPSFGAKNSAQARLTLESILKGTGWQPAAKRPAIPEPVANLFGTFSGGRNNVWRPAKPGFTECYSLQAMIEDSTFFKAMRSFALGGGGSARSIYWVMVADLGGYTTDFAMVGFDLDNIEANFKGRHEGKRLLGDYSEPIGVHDLDNQVCKVLSDEHRKAFESLRDDADGLRIDRFHQESYQRRRPYNTGLVIIGQDIGERARIEEVIRQFADRVAEFAERFLLIEQYDQIDELILTGGGCNIPLVREAIRQKLERYKLKNSHIPVADQVEVPQRCCKLERVLVRGATALGATSVFFDYD